MGFFKSLFRLGGKKPKPEPKTPSNGRGDSATDNSNIETEEVITPSKGKWGNRKAGKNVKPVKKRGPDLSDGTQRPVLSPRNELISPQESLDSNVSSINQNQSNIRNPVDLDESVYTTKSIGNTISPEVNIAAPGDENRLLLPADGEDFGQLTTLPQPREGAYQMGISDYSKTRFSAGHLTRLNSDDVQSDGESSSFNLSTDAEDTEYEAMRRRIGVLPANPVAGFKRVPVSSGGIHSNYSTPSILDTSDVSSPTYNTDGEGSVFPNLPTDDEATMSGSQSGSVKDLQPRSLLGGAPYPDPDDEHDVLRGHRQESNNRIQPGKKADSNSWNSGVVSPTSASQKSTSDAFLKTYNTKLMESVYGTASNSGTSNNTTTGPDPSSQPDLGLTVAKKEKDNLGFAEDPFADFADFSAFDDKFQDVGSTTQSETQKRPAASPSSRGFVEEKNEKDQTVTRKSLNHRSGNSISHSSSASAVHNETSLSELLAQAKSKSTRGTTSSGRRSAGGSVNSAPVITTASYLRQHHNLKSRTSGHSSSVTDIIQSLEAANASRIRGASGRSTSSNHQRSDSQFSGSRDDNNHTIRSAKERVRRRREREERRLSGTASNELDSSEEEWDDDNNKKNESWLFKEVEETLGPRGIAADLESLSGRSNRSSSSRGNRSHKSHRSHRSHRSRTSNGRRRPHTTTSAGSGDSVDSHGEKSHGSRRSRSSRFSHKSARSYISQMSEQSRSVANDLLRLEMQLKMVGSGAGDGGDGSAVGSFTGDRSIGASKRVPGRVTRGGTSSTRSSRPVASTARRSRITVTAPPGKLGIILVNKADSKGTVVSGVRTSSILSDKVHPGDRIVAIDGEDVSHMSVSEITTIMARKSEFERTLTVLTTPRHHPFLTGDSMDNNTSMGSPRSTGKYGYAH